MANEIHRAHKWIYDKLAAAANVTAAVSTRIYRNQAPEGAAYPFVIFNYQSGSDVRGVCARRLLTLPLFQIKVICKGHPTSAVNTAVDAIDTLFQAATAETSESYVFSSRREFPVEYVEPRRDTGEIFTHYGGAYRLVIYPSS